MDNPLVKAVELELHKLGVINAKLIRDSYDPDNFGNAEAVYKLGNLQLRFVRDRSDDTIEFGGLVNPKQFYILDDMAVWMGWLSLGDLLKYDAPINFYEPPPGPILNLAKALSLVARDFAKLENAFSANEIMSTNARLKEVERQRMKAVAG